MESTTKIKAYRCSALFGHERFSKLDVMTRSRGIIAILIFANLLIGFGYLIQTNLTASSGYEIKSWESKVAKLEDENRKLNLDYVELQSMDKLISGAQNHSLGPVKNVETLAVETAALNR